MPLVYKEMHRLVQRYRSGERPGHTLQATALVNAVYLRLRECKSSDWECCAAFFAMCAQTMRRILVDWARARLSAKRRGDVHVVDLNEAFMISPAEGGDLVALDDALKSLAVLDPRKSQIVELRFFGGLSVEVLKVSEITVMRDWKLAKTWLHRELSRGPASGS